MDLQTQRLMMAAAGAAEGETYVDDVFSTFLYDGNSSTLSVNNGVDNTKGGMIWFKARSETERHMLFDTERGTSNYVRSDDNSAQATNGVSLTSFDNDGYTLGASAYQNNSGRTYSSWNFRKAPGFFDVVTYTGNASTQDISHSLKCKPGLILIKRTDAGTYDWVVYHRSLGESQYLKLNNNDEAASSAHFNGEPTDTVFKLDNNWTVNGPNYSYVAYLFAGGESEAATARSVVCDGNGDYLSLGSSSDLAMGTGDFTIEGWYKINTKQNFGFFMNGPSGLGSTYGTVVWNYTGSSYGLQFITSGGYQATGFTPPSGQWFHLALVRYSGTTSLYYNGDLLKASADTTNYTNTTFQIGGYTSAPYLMDGSVSNFRIVKGTAVYTSSFRVPTEPLTAITNTVLLCCNNSSTTGATVTPGTITANGDPTASSDSPFDDPTGFVFGENKDQNVIKCGSYVGKSATEFEGPEINLGWEPQWVMIKRVDANQGNAHWIMLDNMRGMGLLGGSGGYMYANTTGAEGNYVFAGLKSSTGFQIRGNGGTGVNYDGGEYVYIAIRRSDGYVGKPPELGTDVFAMDTGNSSSTIPSLDSGFPVDLGIIKSPNSLSHWFLSSRLTSNKYLETSSTSQEASSINVVYDSNTGFSKNQTSNEQGWMWKRHAGLDVVNYDGTGVAARFAHSLNQTPEMVIIKPRTQNIAWAVFHSGLSANTKQLELDSTASESNSGFTWSPTSTDFNVGTAWEHNRAAYPYLALLFSSVTGISKVGSYTGNGTSSNAISCGFQPRFVFIKRTDSSGDWKVWDSIRGTQFPFNYMLRLNTNNAQVNDNLISFTSTGFSLISTDGTVNASSGKYIFYAHA